MTPIRPHKVGLVFSGFMILFHATWAVMILIGLAQPFMDWIFNLHMITPVYQVMPFNFGSALMLLIITGIIGYIMGCAFGWLWNKVHKMSHGQ